MYPGGLDSVGEGRGLARVDEEEDLVVPGLTGEGGCGEGEREGAAREREGEGEGAGRREGWWVVRGRAAGGPLHTFRNIS